MARAISISKMNFCVEFQPGPPYSLGQLGQSQPWLASFFCHCSSRSLETWLVRLRRLSSATSGGMLAASQSRTSFWKANSSSLKARRIVVLPYRSYRFYRRLDRSAAGAQWRDLASVRTAYGGEKASPLRFAPVEATANQRPNMTFDMMPRCTSDEPP